MPVYLNLLHKSVLMRIVILLLFLVLFVSYVILLGSKLRAEGNQDEIVTKYNDAKWKIRLKVSGGLLILLLLYFSFIVFDYVAPIMLFVNWLLLMFSFFHAYFLRFQKSISLFPIDKFSLSRNYVVLKKWGGILLILLVVYLVIICGILGWRFRWYYFFYIFFTVCFLVLDQFLIGVNYPYWQDEGHIDYFSFPFIKRKYIWMEVRFYSYFYYLLRSVYVLLFLLGLLLGLLLFSPKGVFSISQERADGLIARFRLKSDGVGENPYHWKQFADLTSNGIVKNKDYFNGKIILTFVEGDLLEGENNSAMIYCRKCFVFKKPVVCISFEPQRIYMNATKDTLWLEDSKDKAGEIDIQEYIAKVKQGKTKFVYRVYSRERQFDLEKNDWGYTKPKLQKEIYFD